MIRRGIVALAVLLLGVAPPAPDSFALKLFRELRLKKGNVVLAPVGVEAALRAVAPSMPRTTAAEIRTVLAGATGIAPPGVVNETAVWPPKTPPARINEWVRSRTKGRIPNLVAPGGIDDRSFVVTVATYLKAKWLEPFWPSETRQDVFHLADGRDISVPTMHRTIGARYAEVKGVCLLELRYEQHDLSMLILLPKSRIGLPSVERTLTSERLATWTAALKPRGNIMLALPRFHAAVSTDLKSPLHSLGLRRLFDGLARQHVARVFQDVWIEADEQGTEAAAGTLMGVTGTMEIEPPLAVSFDHPFLYLIRSGNQILFVGRVADPRG
jgi:serpin B